MSGVWVVTDRNGDPVIETPDRIEADAYLEPGFGLDWEVAS